jgi:hypothetical protein
MHLVMERSGYNIHLVMKGPDYFMYLVMEGPGYTIVTSHSNSTSTQLNSSWSDYIITFSPTPHHTTHPPTHKLLKHFQET